MPAVACACTTATDCQTHGFDSRLLQQPPWWSNACPSGEAPTEPTGDCRPCPAGTKQESDPLDGRQRCVSCPLQSLQPRAGQTTCLQCPSEGVDCRNQRAIEVLEGYYMSPRDASLGENISVWRCALEKPCRGGTESGDASCAPGHEGPLCGVCVFNATQGQHGGNHTYNRYYRGREQCEACPIDDTDSVTQTSIIFGNVGVAFVLLSGAYLLRGLAHERRRMARHSARERAPLLWRACRAPLRKLRALLSSRFVSYSTFARIALGFCQCLSVQRRFVKVSWPRGFLDFLGLLDQLTFDIFDLASAECALGRRLGFHYELIVTLATPLALLLMLLVLALVLLACVGRRRRSLTNWPQIWDLGTPRPSLAPPGTRGPAVRC